MLEKVQLKQLDETLEDPHLHEATKMLLTMNKVNHTREELHYILQKMEELPYFKQFVAEKLQKGTQRNDILEVFIVSKKLCSRLRVEFFKGGEMLFEENDTSNDKLYIIIYGQVILMRHKKMDQLMNVQRQNSQAVSSPRQLNIVQIMQAKKVTNKLMKSHNAHQKYSCISKEEKTKLEEQYGECMRIMGEGNGFGEKALAENIPRTLSVACYSQELFVVVLKKEDFMMYQMTFEKTKKEKSQIMFNIFKNVNNEYSSQRLESMIYSCQTISYDRSTQLSIEGETGDAFFIIISGDVTLYKRTDNKVIPLCIVSSGHLFGEEIIINKHGTFEYTALVTSLQAKVIVIDAQEFIHKFPEECRIQITGDYKLKNNNRKQLLRLLLNKNKTELSQPEFTKEQVIKLTEIDAERTRRNRSIENFEKFQDLQLNQNFLLRYTNPSVQSFCIKSIVDREKQLSKLQLIDNIFEDANGMRELNFGDMTADQTKRRRFLFQSKLNQKEPFQNFLKPNSRVLPLSIKREVVKHYKPNRKQMFGVESIYVKSYASPQLTKKLHCKKLILMDNKESSTNIYTQIEQSI